MRGFTIEGVAALSGASKVTIYKWWPSKGALALDGYFTTVEGVLKFPDTGNIQADLRTQLTSFVRLVRDTPAGRVLAELIGEAQTDTALAAAYREKYSGPRRALAVEALARAQGRGQLRADVDPEVVIDQLWGACYHRLLLPDQPLTEEFTGALIDNLFHGLR
jgi:AcrR family transcriptional regulator